MATSLEGRRIVVVGASAGIGRAFAMRAIRDGAEVIVAARRTERLEALEAEAGPCSVVELDLAASDGFERLVATVAAAGPVDLVLSTAGASPLRHLADTTPADWEAVLRTNVSGFNELVRSMLPFVSPAAVLAAVSSESVVQPREGLAAYAASKAALESSIRGWRMEHPGHRFTCIRVGATYPTEFGAAFDGALLGPLLERWTGRGLMQEEFMDPDEVAAVLVDSLATMVAHPGVGVEDIVLRSPSAVLGAPA